MNWHSRLLLDSHENADIVKFLIAIASGTEPALAFENMIQVLEGVVGGGACVVPSPDQAHARRPLCYDMTSLRGIYPPTPKPSSGLALHFMRRVLHYSTS